MLLQTQRHAPLPVVPVHQREARATGVHVSAIIHNLCETLFPKRFGPTSGFDEWLEGDPAKLPKIWIGQSVDQYYAEVLDHEEKARGVTGVKPGSLMLDGLHGTADRIVNEWVRELALKDGDSFVSEGIGGDWLTEELLAYTEADWLVEEHKCSWMSLRHGITDERFKHWYWQVMAYCWMYRTRRARIRMFAINGIYEKGLDFSHHPEPIVTDIIFTWDELSACWDMLVRRMLTLQRKGVLPS
jgi:hypothetical protein